MLEPQPNANCAIKTGTAPTPRINPHLAKSIFRYIEKESGALLSNRNPDAQVLKAVVRSTTATAAISPNGSIRKYARTVAIS